MFDDGSNPFLKYGTIEELKNELSKWRANYNLKVKETDNGDLQVKASPWFVVRSAF